MATTERRDMGRDAGAPERPERPARLWVAAVLAAWLLVGLGWALLTPTFGGVDEGAHTSLVRDVRASHSYPLERTGFEPRTAALYGWVVRHQVDDRFTEEVPADAVRPTFAAPGPVTPRRGVNQMTQHPPLPYVATAGALAVADVALDLDGRPFDIEVLVLRLVHLLVTASTGLCTMAAARRLGLQPWTQVLAGVLPLAVPQLMHVGASVGNDGWLVACSAVTTVGIAAVVSGDERFRMAGLLGLAVGLAALTKAFGLLLLPAVALGYALTRGTEGTRRVAMRAATALGVALAAAGWWWIGNLVRTGSLQPHGAPLRSQAAPPGFEPEGLEWYQRFGSWMTVRYWGWFGEFSRGQRVGVLLVSVATAVALVLLGAALASRRPTVVRFTTVMVSLHLLALVVVAYEARSLYLDTGLLNDIQGRYLFVALPGLAVAAAAGAEALVDRGWTPRWLVGATVGIGAVALHASGVAAVLRGSWGEPAGAVADSLTALRTWSSVGAVQLALITVVLIAIALATAGMSAIWPPAARDGGA